MDLPQTPSPTVTPPKRGGGCLKGCGCLLVIFLIFGVGSIGALYYFGDRLLSPQSINRVVDYVYLDYFRPELEKNLAQTSPDQQKTILSKADRAVADFKRIKPETQVTILKEAIVFFSYQSRNKITPPSEIPNLTKFLQQENLLPTRNQIMGE